MSDKFIRLIIRHKTCFHDGTFAGDMFESHDILVSDELKKKLFKNWTYNTTEIIGFEELNPSDRG
jgi:hypothetical protein